MKRAFAFAMVAGIGVLAGCAQTAHDMGRYPQPIFATKAARRTLPPITSPIVRERSVDAERGWTPPGGVRQRWTDIVIHHSAGPTGGARSFDAYHRNVRHWDELGYHFVIGNGTDTRDGQIEVGSRWTKQKHGAHCKTPDNYYNEHGIGICLVGNFDQTYPTRAQMKSLNRLLRFLTEACNVPVSRIRTHGGVTHKTACPGKNLSLAAVKRDLAASGRALSYAK